VIHLRQVFTLGHVFRDADLVDDGAGLQLRHVDTHFAHLLDLFWRDFRHVFHYAGLQRHLP